MRHLVLAALLLLTACGSPITTSDAGIKSGKFQVASVEVTPVYGFPGDRYMAFQRFQPLLVQEIEEDLKTFGNHTAARQVAVQVEVKQLDLALSGTTALLVGDDQSITSTVYIKDLETGQVLATSKPIVTHTEASTGIVGMLATSISPEEWGLKNLASKHAGYIVDTIY